MAGYTTAASVEGCVGVPDTSGSLALAVTDDSAERLLISAASMDMMQHGHKGEEEIRDYDALMDSGANVVVAPVCLAHYLGLPIPPNKDGRTIGTADSDAALLIVGWIFPEGFTGVTAAMLVMTMASHNTACASIWWMAENTPMTMSLRPQEQQPLVCFN